MRPTRRLFPRARALALILPMFAAVAGGCATGIEEADLWAVDWEKRLEAEDRRTVDVPQKYKPTLAEPPAWPELNAWGPAKLSLEQATLLAMRYNRDLAVEQLNPVIVGTFEQIERGVFDPQVFAEASFNRETASETARSTGERFSVEGDAREAVAGVRQRLPSGTDIEATVEQDRDISNRAPEQQESRLGLTITQSLLRGFGPAVNLARIRQARYDTVASQYELRGFTEALLAEVEIAYWRYVLAGEQIAILERSLAVAKQQAKEIRQQIAVGALAEIDAAAVEAEVALREQALIDGRGELEARRLRLLRLINPNGDGTFNIALAATTSPRIDPTPIDDIDDRLAVAERMRPDLNEAQLRLEQRRLETIITRNGVLPRLEVFIALGKTGFADTFTDSFKQLDGETYDFTAGVRFSHYLGNRAAEARDRAAVASRLQGAAAIANLRQLIRQDVLLALNEVDSARQQIAASTLTRRLQERSAAAEKQRLDAGAGTSLDLARAQRDLLATQIAEVEAVVRYRIALVNLYLAEGTLLDRRGITLAHDDR